MGIYLDNAATSFPKPETVYKAVDDYLRRIGASSGRGAYRRALEAGRVVYEARHNLGRLFNVRDASRIVFTFNVTEALNLALKGLLKEGDHVITTSLEHNAVWRPLKRLERERGIRVTPLPCPAGGPFSLRDLEDALRPNTRMVVMLHASNVTGALMPVEEVGRITRRKGIAFLVDAAQTAGVYPLDVEAMNIDLLAFTGHKGLMGPQGTGGLYIREGWEPEPLVEGGTGSESALEEQPPSLPERYEAGTQNVAGLAGLKAAVEFLLETGVENIRKKEMELLGYLQEGLRGIPGLEIYGPRDVNAKVGVISFNLASAGAGEVAYVLDEVYGIVVRSGLHCAPCAHRTIGTLDRGAVRVSLGYFNTRDDVDTLLAALRDISGRLKG
ncbi:MAG: aminotransferase class V-fold PLP-dependent enzyme [Thermoanaerobacteraceae bacterium]|nr:aminotransferase class V-fold PLP-dependent enzyme [Thermoanaerobacteraceae bacterium]